jgi:phosphotransferase system HPr-like phosphotransfer protein
MSRTIEAIMRHMTLPSNGVSSQRNGTEKLEKEIVVRKRHYVWSEARFVRAMMPFHSNVRVGYDGKEVDGKNVLDLMTLAAPEGPDAAEAMHALEQLMQSQPGENRMSTLSEQIRSFTNAHDRRDREREGANI